MDLVRAEQKILESFVQLALFCGFYCSDGEIVQQVFRKCPASVMSERVINNSKH